MDKQRTLRESFSFSGKGLHTGLEITVKFCPAEENTGYRIKRVDLPEQPIVEAIAENVAATQRGTVVQKNGVSISTIEHGMAALYAAGIDNCLIEVNAPEFPILDGSSIEYVEAIERVGILEQQAPREYYRITKKFEVHDEEKGIHLAIYPDNHFSVTTFIEFPSPVLSNQFAVLEDLANFKTEIASARTFVFVREIAPLLNAGLIKGGDLQNAVVIYDQEMTQDQMNQLCSHIGINPPSAVSLGYLQEKPLRWCNEPARHKLLDIIGDLALIGKFIHGRVVATRPGHGINNVLARAVRKEMKRTEVQVPEYDPNKTPVYDITAIKNKLPHRYPFQLLDKVIEMGDDYCVGVKNITANEPFFMGHFPDEPIMPGVLQIEAMAQCSGLLVLNNVEDPSQYSTYFMKIDNAKFRHKVVPGDTVIFHVSYTAPLRRGCAQIKGYAFVGDKIVSEAEFMAQIIKKK